MSFEEISGKGNESNGVVEILEGESLREVAFSDFPSFEVIVHEFSGYHLGFVNVLQKAVQHFIYK